MNDKKLGLVENYLEVLRKYSDFNGRSRRTEYWYFVIANFIVAFTLVTLETMAKMWNGTYSSYNNDSGILMTIYYFVIFVPSLALSVRRLHDTGKSAWFLLLLLIPFANFIFALIFMLEDSQEGANKYGPNPKSDVE